MGLTLFKIDDRKGIVLDKAAIKLCPGLKLLKEKELLYIILVYDYNSKYHQYPLDQRKNKARIEVYGEQSVNPEEGGALKDLIDEYKSLQYDSKRETLDVFKAKISKIRDMIMYEEDMTKIGKYSATIKLLENDIKQIQEEIETDFKTRLIKGGGELSLLEVLKDNKEKFKKEVRRVTVNLKE